MSLLIAIVFILIISLLSLLTLSTFSIANQKTLDNFLLNQEEILARGAVEYAIMAVGGHDIKTTGSCINQINMSYKDTYDINVTLYYIGSGLPAGCNILDNSLQDPEDNGTAIIDVSVSLKPSLSNTYPQIVYRRRVIQKL